jgi:transcriptional repressor NF-X1
VRCSAVYGPGSTMSRAEMRSCGEICRNKLKCGIHGCARVCHEGGEADCEEVRGKKCFCGKAERIEECGDGSNERVVCRRPGEEGEWEGEWTCEKDCGAYVSLFLPHLSNHH